MNRVVKTWVFTRDGTMCRQKIEHISTQRRGSQGVRILKLDADDEVMAIDLVIDADIAVDISAQTAELL